MTSPVTRAHFMVGRSGRAPMSYMPQRMRRCTGLRPSRASGSARDTMTDMEESRNDRSLSSWISMGSMPPKSTAEPSPSLSSGGGGVVSLMRVVPSCARPSDVEEAHVLGVGLDEVLARLDVVAHQLGEDLVGHDRGL